MSLKHFLSTQIDAEQSSISLLVAPPGVGAHSQLHSDVEQLGVPVLSVNASNMGAPSDPWISNDLVEQIAQAKNPMVVVDTTQLSANQINLLSQLIVDPQPNGVDISHAQFVLFAHDANSIPAALHSKLNVFYEPPMLDKVRVSTALKDRVKPFHQLPKSTI